MKTTKAKKCAKRATFSLEIQHNGENISTQQLETNLKSYLKGLGYSLTGRDLKTFFVPTHEMIYYSLESEETQILSGEVSLKELMV